MADKPEIKNLYTYGEKSIENHVLPDVCHARNGIPQRAVASDVNLRSGYNRYDYENQRADQQLPKRHAEIVAACQAVYKKVGMVRNIIDLMTDFASEGLELQHAIKTQERFFREWAMQVNLAGRAHDYMKLLMRDANVIVRRKNAFITLPVAREMTKGDVVSLDMVDETKVKEVPEKVKQQKKSVRKREIPWKYTFLSPTIIEKIGGDVGKFFGADSIGMRIPDSLSRSIKNPRTKAERDLVKKLPAEVVKAAKANKNLFALDMDKVYVDYYKKDDWEDWGTPFLYGVLEDIMFKEKMRLADMAALDGVINVIRLWKLGNSDKHILPTGAAVDKLINILQHNVGGGVMDLVWDDMIDLKVEYPPVEDILGPEKYASVNADIVRGIGIPDSLVGGADLGTRNAQSAFVQLKTLAERLEYVRSSAIRWMKGELRLVADAMGFKNVPEINFGIMSLRDEAAEKQLVIQLLDRGIISSEKVSEVFGVNYMIEIERLKSEQVIRDENPGVLEKSNPYNRPFTVMDRQNEHAIQIEKVKHGFRKDSVYPPKGGDNGGGDNPKGDQPKDDGDNSPGRPPSTKDTAPRDERTPKTMSILSVVADRFMDEIDGIVDSKYLEQNNIKNMRSLNKSQIAELDEIKLGLLSVLRPGDQVTAELISSRLKNEVGRFDTLNNKLNILISSFTENTSRTPTTKERRLLVGVAWADTMKTF